MSGSPDVDALVERAAITRSVREFFDSRGFVEVETPVRIAAPAPEPHIDCPPVATGGFLRASPELQMKKLLACGMDRIYQIGPCFRDGEKGSRHNPEFTMLEWYRRDATHAEIMEDIERLLRPLFAKYLPRAAFEPRRISVREAYLRHALWDPWKEWDADRFDFDMAEKIEPAIAKDGGAVFLDGYPPQAASLSLVEDGVARRWEFYWNGMELANAFGELCDGEEQRRRFSAAREERRILGESDYPLDEEFIGCVDSIGEAAGVALGMDRLAMVLLGRSDIRSVRVVD